MPSMLAVEGQKGHRPSGLTNHSPCQNPFSCTVLTMHTFLLHCADHAQRGRHSLTSDPNPRRMRLTPSPSLCSCPCTIGCWRPGCGGPTCSALAGAWWCGAAAQCLLPAFMRYAAHLVRYCVHPLQTGSCCLLAPWLYSHATSPCSRTWQCGCAPSSPPSTKHVMRRSTNLNNWRACCCAGRCQFSRWWQQQW